MVFARGTHVHGLHYQGIKATENQTIAGSPVAANVGEGSLGALCLMPEREAGNHARCRGILVLQAASLESIIRGRCQTSALRCL